MADRRPIFRLLIAALVAVALPIGGRSKLPTSPLDTLDADWLASVDHLISPTEKAAFRALEHDIHRELFRHRFWAERGEDAPAAPGGMLERWRRNLHVALDRFETLDDDRARALLVAGPPPRALRIDCDNALRRIEIWSYDPWHARYQSGGESTPGFTLLFFRDGPFERTVVHHWSPDDGVEPLILGGPGQAARGPSDVMALARKDRCFRGSASAGQLADALEHALGPTALRDLVAPAALDEAWTEDFLRQHTTARPSAALLSGAPLEVRFPGRYNDQRTVLEGRVVLPADRFARTADHQLFDRVTIEGDVKIGSKLYDVFHADYYLAGTPPADGLVRLAFFRRLRPGTYTLRVRVIDGAGLALVREQREVVVPRLETDAEPPAGSRLGLTSLTRTEVGNLVTFPSIELLPLGLEVAGTTELAAVTVGGPIDQVIFRVDGGEPIVDTEAPWTADVDLGDRPLRHTVTAAALDPAGRVLADDRLELNVAPPRFAVRLGNVVQDAGGGRRVAIDVDVPAGEQLERVDVHVNLRRAATLRDPPFVFELPTILPRPTAYVRAVAVLASGARLEDVVIVQAAAPVENVDVQLVELYVSVLDNHGRAVTGLDATAFTVRENGSVRPVVRFDTVANLPIDVGLLMDVSASMRRGLATAAESARRFFDTVIGPRDQAMVMAFNHRLQHLMPFTGDVDRLDFATVGLRAWGTTRLRDGIVYNLQGFGGRTGRRALVVLSDGQDVDSDFDHAQVVDVAERAGVAIYPILLDVSAEETRGELEQLANATGGRLFAVQSVAGLDRVYQQIENDLRAQYLLVYRPPEDGPRRFRRIDVTLGIPGLRARTISGYHP